MSDFRKTGGTSPGTNSNGAPLLGDSRDLFRPKASGGMLMAGSSMWGKQKTCAAG